MQNVIKLTQNMRFHLLRWTALVVLAAPSLSAQSISVPNGSFELESAGPPFYANINIASWQKAPRPNYFPAEGYNGFFWEQTMGVFYDTNPYLNRDGSQAAYMLAFPQAAISQDLTATFQTGMAYDLTLGVYGKSMMEGAMLQLSLYYRDDGNNMVTVGTPTIVTFTSAGFPAAGPLNFINYSVNIPVVQAGDAWAGENIGIRIESLLGDGNGYWDMDNARLTAVPEPSSIALAAVAVGGLIAARLRSRKQN